MTEDLTSYQLVLMFITIDRRPLVWAEFLPPGPADQINMVVPMLKFHPALPKPSHLSELQKLR